MEARGLTIHLSREKRIGQHREEPPPRGAPSAARRHFERQGRQFRPVLGQCHQGRICLIRRDRRDGAGADRAARIHRPDLPRRLPDIGPGQIYGYRVHGPYEPEAGHRFNPNKLLLDPYARAHAGELTWDPAVFGYTIGASGRRLDLRRARQRAASCRNAWWSTRTSTGAASPAASSCRGTARSSTRRTSGASPGCTQGAASSCAAPMPGSAPRTSLDYIKSLGVTAVELLPVHTFVDDSYLLEQGAAQLLGLQHASASSRPIRATPARRAQQPARVQGDGRRASTTPASRSSSTSSTTTPPRATSAARRCRFKGIDNASYYRLMPDQPRYYINDTGTGNTRQPAAIRGSSRW